MSAADTSVRVPKVLLERLQREVERLRAERLEVPADRVDREALRRDFVAASASLWSLVQTVRNKERLEQRFLDAGAALWALVQDQADAIDQARRQATATVDADAQAAPEGDVSDDEREQLRAHLAGALQRVAEAEAAREALRAECDALREEVALLRRTHPMPPAAPSQNESVARGPDGSDAEVVGAAFVAWCRRNRSLVSRPYLFAAFLQTAAEGVEVEVRPVYRDRDAAPPAFREAASPSAGDGAEYWLVRRGEAHALLPQPLRPTEFRETAPAFEGEATPETLGDAQPARVRFADGAWRLDAPGRLVAEAPAA
jgi:hypothetical protein